MSTNIRVLLVDDHAVVREGYRRLIEKHEGIEVVGEANDAASAYKAFKASEPDVVIADISMPGRGGIDLVRQIRQLDAHARILMFTMHADANYALQSFRAGAKGYITKSRSARGVGCSNPQCVRWRTALCDEINGVIAASRLVGDVSPMETLSPREFEILRRILDAKSTEEIAGEFNLSPKTVANHHYTIKSKLGVQSDIELVYACMKQGLVASVLTPDGVK